MPAAKSLKKNGEMNREHIQSVVLYEAQHPRKVASY